MPDIGFDVKLKLQVALHRCRYQWLIRVFLGSRAASTGDDFEAHGLAVVQADLSAVFCLRLDFQALSFYAGINFLSEFREDLGSYQFNKEQH